MPAPSVVAGWALKYGPLLLPAAQRLYEQGRWRQLALLHARTLADGSFSWEIVTGRRVWVVWSGDEPVASYPELAQPLETAFAHARPERRQDPDDVAVQRLVRRLSGIPRPSLPALPWRRGDADDEAVRSDATVGEDAALPDDDG